jgi:hypothetical protein
MRKALLPLAVAVVAVVVMAATASARTETRFTVVGSKPHGHRLAPHKFLEHGRVSLPGDSDDIIGRYVSRATELGHHRLRSRVITHFRGRGSLKAKGVETFTSNESRIPIIGGTGEFNGAAGKLIVDNLSRGRLLVTFIFVQ